MVDSHLGLGGLLVGPSGFGHVGQVVGVALPTGRVIGLGIRIGQRQAEPVAFNQIRVCDERNAERDGIGLAGVESIVTALPIVTAILNEGAFIGDADKVRDRRHVACRRLSAPGYQFEYMEIGEIEVIQHRGHAGKGDMGLGIADPEIAIRGRQTYADLSGSDHAGDGLDDLDQEPGAVFDWAAIFVFAPIGPIAQKRVHEKVIRRMYLDTIKARLNGAFRGLRKIGNGPFNFRDGYGAGHDEGASVAVLAQHSAVGFDLGRGRPGFRRLHIPAGQCGPYARSA